MRASTIREFGGQAAAIWSQVLLCGTRSNGKEDGDERTLVAGLVVEIDERHDAPIIVDLSAPERRAMHSPPDGARHLTLPNGGDFFDGDDLAEMRPGQWTWNWNPSARIPCQDAPEPIGPTRPPPPPPPPAAPKPPQQHSGKRR